MAENEAEHIVWLSDRLGFQLHDYEEAAIVLTEYVWSRNLDKALTRIEERRAAHG